MILKFRKLGRRERRVKPLRESWRTRKHFAYGLLVAGGRVEAGFGLGYEKYRYKDTWDRQDVVEVNRADLCFLHISPVAVE